MKNKRSLINFIFCTFCAFFMRAQNDFLISQYYKIPAYYNAGATGETEYLNVSVFGSLLYTKMDKYPKSVGVIGEMPIKLGKKNMIGIGLKGGFQQFADTKNFSGYAQLAYKINFSGGTLSLGIGPGVYKKRIFFTKDDENISLTPDSTYNSTKFDFGAGIFYSGSIWYAGVSVENITVSPQSSFLVHDTDSIEIFSGRSYYFIAGGNIPIKNTLYEIAPSLMLRNCGSHIAAEGTVRGIWKKMISAGISYLWKENVTFIFAFDLRDFYIGYNYKLPVGEMSRFSGSGHELLLSYRAKLNLGKADRFKRKSIRIM